MDARSRLPDVGLLAVRPLVPGLLLALLAGCSSPASDDSVDQATAPPGEVAERLELLDEAVAAWSAAAGIEEAHAAAEAARNLVTGPGGPLYGDADGDGTIAGAVAIGLLPATDGSPGLAGPPAANACVDADVLGGDWGSPAERWQIMLDAIDAWAPTSNTFPSLPSHPQRVVGWASLTLGSDDLDAAREYAGHARLHVNVTRAAYEDCA